MYSNFILTACNQKSIISCDIRRLVLVHVVHHVHVVTLSWKCIVRSHGREYDRRETKSPKHPCMERCNYFFYDHFLLCCMCLLFYNVHLSSCDVLSSLYDVLSSSCDVLSSLYDIFMLYTLFEWVKVVMSLMQIRI